MKLGYHAYVQLGSPTVGRWGSETPRGGVVVFVRSLLRQRPAFALKGSDAQLVSVWAAGCLAGSAYSPPGADISMSELLLLVVLLCILNPGSLVEANLHHAWDLLKAWPGD